MHVVTTHATSIIESVLSISKH